MPLALDADCALAYWMSSSAVRNARARASHETLVERIESGNLPDWAYAPDGSVHVIATGEIENYRAKGVSAFRLKASLPNGSFLSSDEGILIPSPELCFLRLASQISFPELVKVGLLFCGSFCFDEDGHLLGRDNAIATAVSIKKYVSNVSNARGIRNARRAVRYIANGAASPPEINTFLLLCLPVMCGGYGCPMPEPNGHVKIREDVARSLGYSDCYCDLLWREAKCAIEYTSEQFHTGYRKQTQDEIRRTALEAMGYTVILMTKPQLYNQAAFTGVARLAMKTMGKRIPAQTLDFLGKQQDLRKALLFNPSWMIENACRL